MVKQIIVYWNVVKLVFILLAFLIFLYAPVCILNHYISHFPRCVPILIGSLPILMLIFCLLTACFTNGFNGIGSKITDIRYNAHFPFLFKYDPGPKDFRFKNMDALKILQPYDILLRRQERYLEGLVLEQTSFFTHAAIYYGCGNKYSKQVMQAIGSGVGPVSLDDFAKCDEIAILRFNTNLVDDNSWKIQHKSTDETYLEEITLHLPDNTPIASDPTNTKTDLSQATSIDPLKNTAYDSDPSRKKIVELIDADIQCEKPPELSQIGKTEKTLFEYLVKELKEPPPTIIDIQQLKTFMPDILKLSTFYVGRPYDFAFNFTENGALSCVEFVWDCYKALFPLHRIRRKFMYYFQCVRTFVIVPDTFLQSPFFTLQYSSVPISGPLSARKLMSVITKTRLNFYLYALKIIVWQLVIFAVVCLTVRFTKYI